MSEAKHMKEQKEPIKMLTNLELFAQKKVENIFYVLTHATFL